MKNHTAKLPFQFAINNSKHIIIAFSLILTFFGAFIPDSKAQISEKQKQWITAQIRSHSASENMDNFVQVSFETSDYEEFKKTYVRIVENSFLVFSQNDTAYIYKNSSHDDAEIGDISLLLCNNQVFYNLEHVCGGIAIFYRPELMTSVSFLDFTTTFLGENDDKPWIKYKSRR